MSEAAVKISDYYDLRPTDYHVVRELVLSQAIGSLGVCEQTLSLVLQRELGGAAPSLYLKFHGVRELLLQQPGWSLMSIGHVEIVLAPDASSGGRTFLVRDPEQERIIRFECRDFDAHVV